MSIREASRLSRVFPALQIVAASERMKSGIPSQNLRDSTVCMAAAHLWTHNTRINTITCYWTGPVLFTFNVKFYLNLEYRLYILIISGVGLIFNHY